MSCCGEREKGPPERKQRWDFITLSDFRHASFWTRLAYVWLWLMGGVGVAVYAVDTFTAINLLAFDRWSSQVKPFIPFRYSKWIFAGCIFLSFALAIYEWIRAIRVIKRDGVAASYMDPLAASLQSMRSQGFRRFLVYTELTKSKKGTDYVAFFVYFAFQSAVRVILAEGPRQVINALTLYAVMTANIIDQDTDSNESGIDQFFANLKALADQNVQQTLIYCSMLFTLVIWVFSALCLMAAGILYIVFLWHYIPQRDGRLRIYCRRKIDRRLEKIVAHKTQEAIEDDNRKVEKAEKKAELKRLKTGELPPPAPPTLARQPTLPQVDDTSLSKADEKLSEMPLTRQGTNTTVSTLPLYSSRDPMRQGMQRQPTLPDMAMAGARPGMPGRLATNFSAHSQESFDSDAPLLSNAGYAGGEGCVGSPAPAYSRQNSNASSFSRPMPGRTMTQGTQYSQRSFTPTSASSARPPPSHRFPVRTGTGFSFDEPQSANSDMSPVDSFGRPMAPPSRVGTADGFRPAQRRQESDVSYFSRPTAPTPGPGVQRAPTFGSVESQQSSSSMPGQTRKPSQGSTFSRPFTPAYEQNQPTPPPNSYEMTSRPNNANPGPPSSNQYTAFKPGISSSSSTPVQEAPKRNITYAGQPGASGDYFGQQPPARSITAPIDARAISSYGSLLDDYTTGSEDRGASRPSPPGGPPRAHTAGPQADGGGWQNRF